MQRIANGRSKRKISLALLSAFSLGISTLSFPALAGQSDVQAVFDILSKLAEKRGGKLSYEEISESGDTVTLTGISSDNRNEKSGHRIMRIETLEITGSQYEEGKLFSYDNAVAKGITTGPAENQEGYSGGWSIQQIESGSVSIGLGSAMDEEIETLSVGSLLVSNMELDSTEEAKNAVFTAIVPSVSFNNFDWKGEKDFSLQSVQVEPFTFTSKDDKQNLDLSAEAIAVEGFQRFGKTGLELDLLEIGNITGEGINNNRSYDINFAGGQLANFFYPDLLDEERSVLPEDQGKLELRGLQVLLDEKPVFSWKGLTGTTGRTEEGGKVIRQKGAFEDVTINIGNFPDIAQNPQFSMLQEVGLDTLVLNLTSDGSWNSETGKAVIEDSTLTLRDGFSFGFGMIINNYTQQVARAVIQAADVNPENPNTSNANAQMIAALAPVTFEEFTVELQDRSLLERIIDLQAKRTGQPKEQIAAVVGPMATLMLAPYGVPEFAAALTDELNKFMQGGKKITLKAVPPSPINLVEMMALFTQVRQGQLTLAALLDRFNLTVETSEG